MQHNAVRHPVKHLYLGLFRSVLLSLIESNPFLRLLFQGFRHRKDIREKIKTRLLLSITGIFQYIKNLLPYDILKVHE